MGNGEYIVIKKLLTLVFVGAASLVFSQAPTATVSAADDKKASTDSYHYVAQPGDSYSQMARKAVQTYGIKTDTNLSLAQILYAENGLTNEASSPELEVGEKVSLKKATVGAWIEKAKKLSAEQKALWAEFVPFVDFNTNSVGEKRD